MNRITLIVSIIFIAFTFTAALAEEQPIGSTPEGYEWSSDKGALKPVTNNNKKTDLYLFDTYGAMTVSKDKSVGWGVTDEKNLTDLGKEVRGRLLKIDDIASVFIGYRVVMFRKFPLAKWQDMMPEIKRALE